MSDLFEVRESAVQGSGLFLTANVACGAWLLPYAGPRVLASEMRQTDGEPIYWMAWDDDWVIDGSSEVNLARYVNHACSPNSEAEVREGSVWIRAKVDILKGTELTLDYGWGLEGLFEHPCRCNTEGCIGYIVGELHRPLGRRLLRRMRRHS